MTSYRSVRAKIHTGDLLLYRRPESLIARETEGEYSHAAMALWHKCVLAVAESREWVGARVVTLSSQVERYDGVIDVFRPRMAEANAQAAAEVMFRQAGHDYGYLQILRASLMHCGLLRLLGVGPRADQVPEPTFDEPKFCSCQVIWSYRQAGFDPCPGLASPLVEPNHLRHSSAFNLLYEGLCL
jgi:hypothetical protein